MCEIKSRHQRNNKPELGATLDHVEQFYWHIQNKIKVAMPVAVSVLAATVAPPPPLQSISRQI